MGRDGMLEPSRVQMTSDLMVLICSIFVFYLSLSLSLSLPLMWKYTPRELTMNARIGQVNSGWMDGRMDDIVAVQNYISLHIGL